MNKIKNNKKLFAIILIISLFAILLGSYAIYKNSNKTETAYKIENSEKLEKKAEKKLKEAKKSGDKEEIAKAEKELKEAEEKTEEVKNKKNTSSSSASSSRANTSKQSSGAASKASTSSSSATTNTKPSPKPKEKTKVWIVDKPAWTENIVTPTYSEKTTWYVITQDGKSTKCYSEDEAQTLCAETDYSSYYEDTERTLTGYDTEEINHPEEGHWEYR